MFEFVRAWEFEFESRTQSSTQFVSRKSFQRQKVSKSEKRFAIANACSIEKRFAKGLHSA